MVAGTIGLIGLAIYLRAAQRIGAVNIKITDLQRRDGEAMSYIVTYIIPFIAIPYSGVEQGIALSIFFVVLAILYVNSNMLHINPMLNLGRYHLYEVTLENGSVQTLITKHRMVRGGEVSAITIGEDILLEKET